MQIESYEKILRQSVQLSSVQSLSRVRLFEIPWTAACQASVSIPTSRVHPNSCPLSRWDLLTISFSVVPFSSHPQSLRHQGLFKWVSSSHQVANLGVSDSTSVLPMNTQDWSPLGWTGWISFQSKGLSRAFSNTTVQNHQYFIAKLYL